MTKRLLLGGVLAVLVVGCAGDALSKEEYVSKLNAMCEDFSAREKEIGEPQNRADLVEKGPRILDAFEEAIVDEVRNLEAPDEIAAQASRLADLAEQQRDVLAGLVDAAKNNDLARVRNLSSRNEALNRESNAIMRELGAAACSED